MGGASQSEQIEWTSYEVMLWETARIVGAILRGETLPGRPTNFALSMSSDFSEVVLVSAPYRRDWLGAVGDGTYRTNTTFVGGFSAGGMLLGAATLGGSALANSARKSRAKADASVTWRALDAGLVHVSNYGFYLDCSGKLAAFGNHALQRIDLTGPGSFQWTSTMDGGGAETFHTVSEAAELVFVLWALARCPTHPQFVDRTWLPESFIERVKYAGLMNQLGGGSLGMIGTGS